MRHTWKLDDFGLDFYEDYYNFHSIVLCTDCSEAFCIFCTPNWNSLDNCEGPED